jgi:hypothetical protein
MSLMKRIFTLTALLICTSLAVQSQLNPPEWTKNFGGSGWDWARSTRMVGTSIVTAGSTLSSDNDWSGTPSRSEDMFIVKTDISGNVGWKKKIGGSGIDICYAVEIAADGGYILAGSTTSDDGDATNSGYHAGNDNPDFWIVKLNAEGDIEWQHAFGGSGMEEAKGITQTDDDGDGHKDDGYAIVGWTDSQDGDITGNHGRFDTWVIKLSASGNLEWEQCLGGTHVEYGRDIEQTTDGGFLVVSDTYSNDGDVIGYHPEPGYPFNASADWWITKLDAAGSSIEWSKCYGGSYVEVPFEIKLTNDGGFIITGDTESFDGDVPLPEYGGYDMLVVKFDLNGNTQWEQRLGGSSKDRGYSIQPTLDGGYIVLGTSNSNDGKFEDIDAKGMYDFVLVKFTAAGVIEWKQNFGGSGDDEAMSIQETPSGCYIVAGSSTSNNGDVPGNYGDADVWILNWCKLMPILPVTWGEFKARVEAIDRVVLEWNTLNEQNNARFEIQRSVDGRNFQTIGTVKGGGSGHTAYKYGFIDRGVDELETEVIYYRLRQVDADGKSTLSKVATVILQPSRIAEVKIWPNPSEGLIQVQLINAPARPVKATVYNANGQVVVSADLLKANNEINLRGKNKGTYFIRLDDANGFMQIQQAILR